MILKIVHASDFHIGAALSQFDTGLVKMRGDEIRASLTRVVDFCKEKSADALVITGDLFDSHKPLKSDAEFVRNVLASLYPTDIYIIAGNHDYMCSGSPYEKENYFSENVHIFPCCEASFELPCKDTVFWGKSYDSSTTVPSFENTVMDSSKINIMLLHGDTEKSSPFNIITQKRLSSLPVNYAAFGHIHAGEIFGIGPVSCAYSGIVEGHSFKDSGTTGIIYAEISKEKTTLTPIDFSLRKFINLTIDVTARSENEIIADIAKQTNGRDFFRVTLIGEHTENTPFDVKYIKDSLSGKLHYLDISDETTPAYDFDLISEEDTLRGAFLRELRERSGSEEEFVTAAKIGLDALSGIIPDMGGAL